MDSGNRKSVKPPESQTSGGYNPWNLLFMPRDRTVSETSTTSTTSSSSSQSQSGTYSVIICFCSFPFNRYFVRLKYVQ